MKNYALIGRDEERLGQYASKARALAAIRRELAPHRVILTTCYRMVGDFSQPRTCWATCLDLGYRKALRRAWP